VCSVIQKLTEKLTHYTKGGEGAGEMNKTKGLSCNYTLRLYV
jgi:hypothetical protein